MANRIIIVDGDWTGDNIRFVPRSAAPITITNVEPGEWFITNTTTNANGVTVQVPPQQTSFSITETENGFVVYG